MIKAAEARRSEAITCAPLKGRPPDIKEDAPSLRIRAPIRPSSAV
eukprot:CAMPEP_0172322520 /NCGR_PEP_ID=MMETSP1058-20130122/46137_1 /TAXON_ID=83371 /ORGANISM="Detonula confervacea, Strain CCMP 353" /LENGTH=44 /DNA_ID= /DNA_START= /DNA_END= /DNA_ORIENTATION=